MKRNIRWITETAVMLALLICLQWIGSQIPEQMTKQLVTGSLVNAVLAVTVLVAGLSSGVTVAVISPAVAYYLNIAPNFIAVGPIMLANVCYVFLLWLFLRKNGRRVWKQTVALISASFAKFSVLYLLVVKVICGLAADSLLGKKMGDTVLLAPKMLQVLPAMFSWPQLVTALVGGTLALLIVPVLRKALHR